MWVPQLHYPGVFLDDIEGADTPVVISLLRLMEEALTDAALSLDMFNAASAYVPSAPTFDAGATEGLPRRYRHRLPFLHARSFVFALDHLGKALEQLPPVKGMPREVKAIKKEWRDTFRTVTPVRDDAHHQEDRVRGFAKSGQLMEPSKPVSNALINSPGGSGIWIGAGLDENRYSVTHVDGSRIEVEISQRTLETARDLVQRLINAFTWNGPPQTSP